MSTACAAPAKAAPASAAAPSRRIDRTDDISLPSCATARCAPSSPRIVSDLDRHALTVGRREVGRVTSVAAKSRDRHQVSRAAVGAVTKVDRSGRTRADERFTPFAQRRRSTVVVTAARRSAMPTRRALLTFVAAAAAAACTSPPAAAVGSIVDVQIVDRARGDTLTSWRHRGSTWVAGRPGDRYAVRLTNRSGGRVLVVLSVDGVNAVS